MIKVLIFEDNKFLRESLQKLIDSADDLSCAGTYPDGNDVISNVAQVNPDVILMDIEMPGINGIDAVKMIRNHFPTMHILMLTVFEDNDKIFASICAGATGYILKKTAPEKIIDAVKEVYGGGAAMTGSVAMKILQMFKDQSPSAESQELFELSEREKEVLVCLVKGMSYKMIADTLCISIDTVSSHLKKIYEKLHVHSKSEAVIKAIKQKIV